MTKSSATTKYMPAGTFTKLTGRTDYQAAAARKHMAALVVDSTASTITFSTDPTTLAGAVDVAINEAKAAGLPGNSQALHSLRRVLGAWGMRNSGNATKAQLAQAAKVVTNLPAANRADAREAAKATGASSQATKASGRKLAREGAAKRQASRAAKVAKASKPVDAQGRTAPAGYEVRWPHASFDLLKRTTAPASKPAWLVRCNAHGTTTPAANASQGDAKGSRTGRPEWCTKCANAASLVQLTAAEAKPASRAAKAAKAQRKAAKAPAPAKVAAKAAPNGKLAPRTRKEREAAADKAAVQQLRAQGGKANLPVFDGLMRGLATGDMSAADAAVKATKASGRKPTARQTAAAKRAAAKATK